MVIFPNCKINLGLHIVRKREDGFHDLETIFYPLPLCDALEIVDTSEKKTTINLSGIEVDGILENNICLKAYELLKNDFELPPVTIHLHKVIPLGAGLGGGSSDGAFTLLLLNKKFNLNLSAESLLNYALQLGSDCPFFIKNVPCFARQRGEKLDPISLDLAHYKFLLVHPGIHINTGWAFSKISPKSRRVSPFETVRFPIESWKDELLNDFEEVIFEQHPSIRQIKQMLYENGALYASMTGSGSSVYGIFKKEMPDIVLKKGYASYWL